MKDCIFCKIVADEVPNYTVYENENVLAFLDIFPHAKGHTVVIPKQHIAALSELTSVQWGGMALGLEAVVRRIAAVLCPDGYNIGINDRPAAGQVVPHVHWHIFPRYAGDGGGSVHSIIKNPGNLPVSEVAKLFL